MFNQDYLEYYDRFGFVGPEISKDKVGDRKGAESQNGVRFTCEEMIARLFHNKLDEIRFTEVSRLFAKCEREKGLLMRDPENGGGPEGPDNTYAMIWFDSVFNTGFCKRFLDYGRTNGATYFDAKLQKEHKPEHYWIGKVVYEVASLHGKKPVKYSYNQINPRGFTTMAYMYRQPNIVTSAMYVNGEEPSCLRKKIWKFGIERSADKNDQDGKWLGLFQILVGRQDPENRKVIEYWQMKLREHFPNGMGEVSGRYFNPAHFDHPTAKWLNRYYGEAL